VKVLTCYTHQKGLARHWQSDTSNFYAAQGKDSNRKRGEFETPDDVLGSNITKTNPTLVCQITNWVRLTVWGKILAGGEGSS